MQRLFQFMQEQDWLVEYSRVEGLERILFHMSKRTSFPSNFPKAVAVVEKQNAFAPSLCRFLSKASSTL